jgi:hypothetical protein
MASRRLLGHPRQLGAVVADVGHLVRHDQMVLVSTAACTL